MTADAFDAWLRDEGYPFLVPSARRRRDLLARSAPGLGAVALYALGQAAIVPVSDAISADVQSYDGALFLLFLLAIEALPFVALGVLSYARRRSRARQRAWTVVALLSLFTGLGISVLRLLLQGAGDVAGWDSLIAIACVILGTWSGVWALLGWMTRTTFRQIGTAATLSSRALPVILLFVLFTYFRGEMWTITDLLDTPRLILFGCVLGVIVVLALLRSTSTDIAEIGHGGYSRGERRNVRFILIGGQISLGVVFGGLIAVVLLVIGKITLSAPVIQGWVKHPPHALVVADVALPVDTSNIKVAVFFAAVAAMNLLVSMSIDPAYKSAYVAPIVERARIVLARHAEWETDNSSPGI